jgi:hypothetical protein
MFSVKVPFEEITRKAKNNVVSNGEHESRNYLIFRHVPTLQGALLALMADELRDDMLDVSVSEADSFRNILLLCFAPNIPILVILLFEESDVELGDCDFCLLLMLLALIGFQTIVDESKPVRSEGRRGDRQVCCGRLALANLCHRSLLPLTNCCHRRGARQEGVERDGAPQILCAHATPKNKQLAG